jgi:hypothetical protein
MKPIEEFIPRTVSLEVQKILDSFSSWLEEIVNFGSNIVSWDIEKARGEEEILPPILFLRNFLEYTDACSILVKQSSIEPCNSMLRTVLENFLSLEYLLQEKKHERSLCFIVWNAFENKQIFQSMDRNSVSYKRIEDAFNKDKIFHGIKPFALPDIELRIKNNERLLEYDKYKSTVSEFFRTKKNSNKNPNWYSLYNGPRNVEQLADRLGFNAYYEILYRGLSSSTHGTSIIQGKVTRNIDYGVDIHQIRLPASAQTVTTLCINLSTYLFKTYIHKRLPNKIRDFDDWIKSLHPIFKALETRDLIKII